MTNTVLNNDKIIANSSEMKSLVSIIDKLKNTNIDILIVGEPGTGKSFFARKIHEGSNRKDKPFVVVNCGSLTPDTFDVDFFGYIERGGNTDIIKTGIVERAEGGTLYLDDITSLPYGLQEKMLDFLEKREYTKVGSSEVKQANVRIIASTSKRLEQEIKIGHLKPDFYYRLKNVISIVLRIPPLRKRKEDFMDLLQLYLGDYTTRIDETALELLKNHIWPGNVRELINIAEKIKILLTLDSTNKKLTKEDLPEEIKEATKYVESNEYPKPLADIEREHILKALSYFKGNKSKTAQALGITLKTLYNKLERYQKENLF